MSVFLIPLPRLTGLCLVVLAPAVMATTTTVIQNPGSGTNHIEISSNTANNTATGVQKKCADNPKSAQGGNDEVNVNSVNINKQAMVGKTIIITGRNSRDVVADKDCNDKKSETGAVNVNSINIR